MKPEIRTGLIDLDSILAIMIIIFEFMFPMCGPNGPLNCMK